MAISVASFLTGRRLEVRTRCKLAALSMLTLATSVDAQVPSVDSLRKVLTHATYVFQGVVRQWNAVADPSLSPNPRHAIVRVTQVFSCPVAVGDFANENVTIRYPNPSAAPAGTRAWFLGTGWVIGDHVATSVLSLVPAQSQAQSDSLVSNVRAAIRLSTRDALRASALASDSIVIATIQSVGPPHAASGARSEHALQWSSVRVAVDSVRGFERDAAGSRKFSAGWVAPPESTRNTTILVPASTGFDTTAFVPIGPGARRLLFLDHVARRPNLHNVDSTAVAFLLTRANIHLLADTAMLGQVLPNPVLGMEPVHPCGIPFR